MVTQNTQQLIQLARQLADTLVTATYYADRIRTVIQSDEQHARSGARATSGGNGASQTDWPLLDQATFTVTWHGKSLHLGHTRCYWLLARLARRPNHYVAHLDLLNEVWDDEDLATATIRLFGSSEGWSCPQIARVACRSPDYIRLYIKLVENGEDRLIQGVEQSVFPISFAIMVVVSTVTGVGSEFFRGGYR